MVLNRVLQLVALSIASALCADAGVVNIGYITYSNLGSGVNGFSIANLTGLSSLPPDFSVLDSIIITSPTLTLVSDSLTQTLNLSPIGEGTFTDASIQFPDTTVFLSATFAGSVPSSFLLADNSTFVPAITSFSVTFLPDAALETTELISVTSAVTASVPEPATTLGVGFALALLAFVRRRAPVAQ